MASLKLQIAVNADAVRDRIDTISAAARIGGTDVTAALLQMIEAAGGIGRLTRPGRSTSTARGIIFRLAPTEALLDLEEAAVDLAGPLDWKKVMERIR